MSEWRVGTAHEVMGWNSVIIVGVGVVGGTAAGVLASGLFMTWSGVEAAVDSAGSNDYSVRVDSAAIGEGCPDE